MGLQADGLLVATARFAVLVLPGSEHTSLPWRKNLALLARCPGLPVCLFGRDVPDRPRTIVGLALESPALHLPDALAGRVNLGLDPLDTRHLPAHAPAPIRVPGAAADRADPLAPLRRRVDRALLGGAASLPGEAMDGIAREATRLRAAMAPGAADLLVALATAARGPGFAEAWLAAAAYLQAADATRARRGWE
jgi:hypothetical protein